MDTSKIIMIILAAFFVIASFAVIIFIFLSRNNNKEYKPSFRNADDDKFDSEKLLIAVESTDNKVSLSQKLIFADWSLPIPFFRSMEVLISVVACIVFSMKFNIVITLVSLFLGPLVMNTLLEFSINKRFKNFDTDYPSYILSIVGLLKTGMNTTTALETAVQTLDDNSLVKQEVLLMLERLRFGVSEEKSIGSFAEDIDHPEIELFVQALILSKRVGGNLSETLERLAGQVRQRQNFRNDAVSAVGMQKGSIIFILILLVAIEAYLYVMFPEAIIGSIQHEMGWQVWQIGILMMIFGIWFLSRIIKIKV